MSRIYFETYTRGDGHITQCSVKPHGVCCLSLSRSRLFVNVIQPEQQLQASHIDAGGCTSELVESIYISSKNQMLQMFRYKMTKGVKKKKVSLFYDLVWEWTWKSLIPASLSALDAAFETAFKKGAQKHKFKSVCWHRDRVLFRCWPC